MSEDKTENNPEEIPKEETAPKEEITRTKFEQLLFRTNITLQEIKEATKVSYPTLIDLKKGRKKKYRPRTLRDIAAYLDVSVSDLIDDGQNTSDDATPFEKLLKEIGKTVHEASEATGISYPILQDLKNGKKKNYRERTLRDVCDWFKLGGIVIEPKDLLPPDETNNEKPKE